MPKNMHPSRINGIEMNFEDPLNELREVRESHSAQFGHNMDKIVEDIQKVRQSSTFRDWKYVKRRKSADQSIELTEVDCSEL